MPGSDVILALRAWASGELAETRRSKLLSLLAVTFAFAAVMVAFSPIVALVFDSASATPTASWNLNLSSSVLLLPGGSPSIFVFFGIERSFLDVMVRCSVRVFDTSAVRLKSPPAVIAALPVISARASAFEVTTVTPTETGMPNSVGDVLSSLFDTAVDSTVTSPPAVITTPLPPISIREAASDSRICTGGGAAALNWLPKGVPLRNDLARALNFVINIGRSCSAA